jgi:UDPglucose 6-dehydrogenase
VLESVEAVNDEQKRVLTNKVLARFGNDLAGRTFALWGLAFKPNTDDMREAPSRVVLQVLLRAGARVVAHDPIAVAETQRVLALDFADAPALLERISFSSAKDPLEALADADALIIVTEWKAYRSPNLERLKALMKSPVVFDGRNLYEPATMKDAGIVYQGIGRNSL